MTKKSIRTTLVCSAFLMGSTAIPAFAETMADEGAADASAPGAAAGAETVDNNAIIVTATRRSTTLQDAPNNISAISADDLAKKRIDDVKALSAFTPGMTVTDTGPNSSGNIILRGISSGDTSTFGSNYESSIGVYLGEVPLYLDFKLIDISRVEVLQGPQGTLYGLGTLAGAVRYIPNRPNTDKFSVDGHGRNFVESHSSQIGYNGDIAINVPILKDHIAFRASTGYYFNPGFIDYTHLLKNPGVSDPQPVRSAVGADGGFGTAADYTNNFTFKKDVNYERTFSTRNQLLIEINPAIKAYFTYAHQVSSTGGRQANGAGVLGTGRYEGPWRYLEPNKRKADLISAEFNIDLFGIAQLVSTTATTKQRIDNEADNTDLLLDLNYGYEAFPKFSSHNQSTSYYRQFNQEMRLVSTHGGPFSWVVGGFYNNLRYTSQYREYVPGFANFVGVNRPDDLEYMSFVNTRTKEKAGYGEGTFHITKAWQVTGGLRYYKYDAFAEGGTDTPLFGGGLTRTPYPLVVFDPSRIKSGSTSSDGLVWKANSSYKVNDGLLIYGTYSTGYRTGNVNRVAPCTFTPDNVPPGQNVCAYPSELAYGPDKTRNIELGVRYATPDKRLELTVSGFRVHWNGIQVPSSTVNGAVGITVNASRASSKGFEVAGQFKITPRLVFQGTYSYTDARLTGFAKDIVVSQTVPYSAYSGDRLPGSTKNSGAAQLTYTYPLANGADIEANWAATYTGNIYSRLGLRGNGEILPGYTTHRASVTYRAKAFEVSAYADNIFNKYAVTAISNDISSYNQVRTDVVERYYAQGVLTPRRIGVDLRFHY